MVKIAEVLVNIAVAALNKTFSYIVPNHLEVAVGYRVLVPFGSRKVEGFVLGVTYGDDNDLKAVIDTIDEVAWFDENMVCTARWLSEYYLCTVVEAMRLFLIGKSGIRNEKIYTVCDAGTVIQDKDKAGQIIEFVQEHGQATETRLKREFGDISLLLKKLVNHNFLAVENKIHKTAKGLYKNVVQLAVSQQFAKIKADGFQHKPAQKRIIQLLIDKKELYPEDLKKYQISRDAIHRLEATGIIARK